jgi:hypothetical protein
MHRAHSSHGRPLHESRRDATLRLRLATVFAIGAIGAIGACGQTTSPSTSSGMGGATSTASGAGPGSSSSGTTTSGTGACGDLNDAGRSQPGTCPAGEYCCAFAGPNRKSYGCVSLDAGCIPTP